MLNDNHIKKRNWPKTLFLLFFFADLSAQVDSSGYVQEDTVLLHEVSISAYLGDRPVLRLPASVALIDSTQLHKQSGQSLVPVLNTVPGVRMEERSPGSYRLSIRGSLMRSPFGIRNTKIYLDEFPLTNAGGDSYLNLIDLNSISRIEILKGPDGSLFGANSGGVVRLQPVELDADSTFVSAGVSAGSYGLFQQNVKLQLLQKRGIFSINQGWQRSNGYRKNSALDRKFVQMSNRFNYGEEAQLRVYFFYSDLNYQTPGGLTLAQFKEDPSQARPATKFTPGAIEQHAGIRNRTFFGGVVNDIPITEQFRHVISVFGSQTLFENPFITNYEIRNEANAGARTWFEFTNDEKATAKLKWNIGGEFQEMQSGVSNYDNVLGKKDSVQAIDDLEIRQGFVFTRLIADIENKWIIEASVSYNLNRLAFSRSEPITAVQNTKVFEPQLMPRLAASFIISNFLSLRAIVSRGYSPPTLQEIRSSNLNLNTQLQPEGGWNYEAGFRLRSKNERLWWDVSAFYYELNKAIVKRVDSLGQDYFINAGTTFQPGIESQVNIQVIKKRNTKFIRGLQLTHAYSFTRFRFGNYTNDVLNYSGNELTGVPQEVSVTGVSVDFPIHLYLFAQHNHTSRIPLNDLNSEYASSYDLVQLKAGWRFYAARKFMLDLSVGIDNLLDQNYSLGNDLNAVGGRYYNAALPRNYFGKLVFVF